MNLFGEDTDPIRKAAGISADQRYRYWLRRTWGPGPRALWVMLNPSTADARQDDPTIRRCVGFSRGWGFGGLAVVNLFAYRATDPDELAKLVAAGGDPIGPENEKAIAFELDASLEVVAAWGSSGPGPLVADRAACVRDMIRKAGRPVWCLGTTNTLQPRHPLYVKGDTLPIMLQAGAGGWAEWPSVETVLSTEVAKL